MRKSVEYINAKSVEYINAKSVSGNFATNPEPVYVQAKVNRKMTGLEVVNGKPKQA
jgi:hypothetical protein